MSNEQTPIRVVVCERFKIDTQELPAYVVEELALAFTHKNPQHVKLKKLGYYRTDEPEKIETFNFEETLITLPLGGWKRIKTIFKAANLRWTIEDKRTMGNGPRGIPTHSIPNGGTLWDYQLEVIDSALKTQVCLCRSPTGSGKTSAALAIASFLDLCTLIIVPTKALLKQWVERIEAELGISKKEIGYVVEGKVKIAPITVGLVHTVTRRIPQIKSAFGLVIFDEVHRASSPSFMRSVDQLPAKYRIGVSDSEKRRDRKEFLIYDVFGDVVADIAEDRLVDKGSILDVEVKILPTNFTSLWMLELRDQLEKLEAIEPNQREPKDAKALLAITRAIAQSSDRLYEEMKQDAARNSLVIDQALIEASTGRQTVLLTHRREFSKQLADQLSQRGIPTGMLLGGQADEAEFEQTKSLLKVGKLFAASGTYQAFGTGLDVPSIEIGIGVTPIANSPDNKPFFRQVRGRLCRTSKSTNKKSAVFYYVWDWKLYGAKPLKNLRAWCNRASVKVGDEWVEVGEFLKSDVLKSWVAKEKERTDETK